MMSAERVALGLLLLVQLRVSILLQLSNAETINCTVTLDAEQTLYSVPRFNATNCHYRWTNSTDHVLANHHEKNELVTINTNWRFQIKGCLEEIHYRRDCIPEGLRETICTTTCDGNQSRKEIKRHHWPVLGAVLFLMLVVLFLCYKFMNHPCRYRHSKDG